MDFGNGVAAHRGNMSVFPENTMEAFESAIAMGCSWIELDIQLTTDKQLVVTHDANALRVTGVDKVIVNSSYPELLSLNFGAYLNGQRQHAVPLLSEVFELVKGTSTAISIQPKNYGLIKQALQLAKGHGMLNQIGFNDTNCEYLIEVKQLDKNVPVFWDRPPHTDFETDLLIAKQYKFETLMYEWPGITEEKIKMIKRADIRFGACVINDYSAMMKYVGMGVQHYYTDFPEQLLKLV
ncbi:MAG: glycerophosphodiester phosphodiesterase family protein [bacterium]|nr:glycerophosphodiester phosphodiesterase family protein [bacterium]